MARIDSDDELDNANEKYHESSDEDFNPESAPAEDASSSEDEDDILTKPTQRKGKRKAPIEEELDSGDELTIQAARKKRAKKKKGGKNDEDDDDHVLLSDDDGGEGGLIKTRAQRQVERKERKTLARTEGATVDVDALWAQMTAMPLKPVRPVASQEQQAPSAQATGAVSASAPAEEEEQVTVKKIYTFAGQDTTEEKQIPRSQLDAHLASGWKTLSTHEKSADIEEATTTTTPEKTPQSTIRRPLRRPTRFDPNPTGFVRALAPEHQLSWPRKSTTALHKEQENAPALAPELRAKPEKAHKLNVVDKSRMDWTGFVDKEGIAEELDTHGKTKEAYLGRMEFLAGVDARREEERRNLKLKAAAATAS